MRISGRQIGFVAALALSRVAFGYQFQTMAGLGPELLARFGLDYAALGGLIGLYMAPGIVAALPGGLLGRRFGERLAVGGGLALMALGGAVSALSGGPGGIGLGRVLAGSGAVLLVVMQGKMVSDRFPGQAFMPVTSLLVGAFPVGTGLVGLTLGPLVRAFGWPGPFIVGGAVSALSLLLFLLFCGQPAQRQGARGGWAMPSLRECVLVVVAGLIWTWFNAGYYGFLSYMPSVMASRGHAPGLSATVLLVATWATLPSTMLGGVLAVRWGAGAVILAGAVGMVLAVGGPALLDWPLFWGAIFGALAGLGAGVVVAVGTLSCRPENRAAGMGLFYTTYYLGCTLIPVLCGRAADLAGDPAAALLTAAVLAGLVIPTYLWHRALQRRFA